MKTISSKILPPTQCWVRNLISLRPTFKTGTGEVREETTDPITVPAAAFLSELSSFVILAVFVLTVGPLFS